MLTDEALLVRARDGDDAALAELVERHAGRVLRFGVKLCRDREDAQEVLQSTLLTVARKIRDFRGESRFSTWLYTIARSFCVKVRTRARKAEPLEAALEAPGPAGESPDEKLASRELRTALERAISRLEPGQREVLVLRDIEGLSAAEVASVVGLSVDAVKSRLHRARKALRQELAPFFGESPASARCPDIIELFSRYREGDIDQQVCRQMEAHLEQCARCRTRCDSLRELLSACSTSPEPQVPDTLRAALVEAMRGELMQAQGSA